MCNHCRLCFAWFSVVSQLCFSVVKYTGLFTCESSCWEIQNWWKIAEMSKEVLKSIWVVCWGLTVGPRSLHTQAQMLFFTFFVLALCYLLAVLKCVQNVSQLNERSIDTLSSMRMLYYSEKCLLLLSSVRVIVSHQSAWCARGPHLSSPNFQNHHVLWWTKNVWCVSDVSNIYIWQFVQFVLLSYREPGFGYRKVE